MTYTFGDYELDTMLYELRYAGEPCKLEPRVFNVLAYLIAHRTQVVTRDELLDALWPGLFNSVSLLNTCIMEVRKAVGDSGQVQQVIKTFRGRGYRFIAPTTEQRKEDLAPETSEGCDVPLSTAPPAQEDVLGVSPAPGGSCEAFQDVLAGDQTVGTIVCGSWDEGELGTGGEGEEPRQRLRQTFFARAQEEVQRYAGSLSFFGADGILMLFTQEAHAKRAVRAALGLQHRMQDAVLARDAQRASAGTVRYGIHTGPVVVPRLTDLLGWTSLTTAESTTVAVWLHALALPATLLTSTATLPFIQAMAQWTEHGAVRIPGLSDPLMAYRIWAPHAATPRHDT